MVTENNNYPNNSFSSLEKSKLIYFPIPTFLSLIILGVIAILIRFFHSDPEVPFTGDAIIYFVYAIKTSILGHLPEDFTPMNNGWPAFLSIFFSVATFSDALSYMQLQRLITILISVITIIPVYFLCSRFFRKEYSLVGAAIFAFEPRIVQNSLLGGTDPLYICLVSTALVLFLHSNKKIVYLSFAITALSTLVRSEGLFLLFAFSIMFFVRYRKEKLVIPKFIPAIIIFILIISPMAMYRLDIHEEDGISSRVFTTFSYHIMTPDDNSPEWEKLSPEKQEELKSGEQTGLKFFLKGLENFTKYIAWNSIPIFVFFLPIGTFLIFKNLNYRTETIIVSTIFMSIPAFYAYSIPLFETRYLFFLYPLFCVISIFTIFKFLHRFKNQNYALVLIICGILLASVIFLDFKKTDYEHEKELVSIAKYIVANTQGINDDSSDVHYFRSADLIINWPDLPYAHGGKIERSLTEVSSNDFNSLNEFIENSKEEGLTHIVIDGDKNRPSFLNDIFYNEEKYSYLIKEYDSQDLGFKYHVKIFRIDYDNIEK